ncbi:MAG: hypothetical protein JW860_03490 [Sedimentisphaerales bacterium]|nr:hypothetical protein [Sedimentisphaerales bacterium]
MEKPITIIETNLLGEVIMKVTVDTYTRVMLTIIAVLLTLVGIGLWVETPRTTPAAYGGIPDSGQQLDALLVEAKQINDSLTKINTLLTSGKVKVQVMDEERAKGKTGTPAH